MVSDERWNAQSLKRLEVDVRSLPKHPVLSEEGAGSALGKGDAVRRPQARAALAPAEAAFRDLTPPPWFGDVFSLRPLLGGV